MVLQVSFQLLWCCFMRLCMAHAVIPSLRVEYSTIDVSSTSKIQNRQRAPLCACKQRGENSVTKILCNEAAVIAPRGFTWYCYMQFGVPSQQSLGAFELGGLIVRYYDIGGPHMGTALNVLTKQLGSPMTYHSFCMNMPNFCCLIFKRVTSLQDKAFQGYIRQERGPRGKLLLLVLFYI